MFEPIGGTAPDTPARATINPLAAIGAIEMLLASARRGRRGRARRPRHPAAVHGKMRSMRAGEMGYTTSEVGDLVVEGASA